MAQSSSITDPRSRGVIAALLASVLLMLVGFNLHQPFDRILADFRFDQSARPASKDIVFVDIDGAALDSVGVWPWPRSVYAEIIEKLLELGAFEVWVDIDFSAASTPDQDNIFAEALQAGGGYVHLAAFERADGEETVLARPHPAFLSHAGIFAVNAWTDQTGVVRAIPAFIRNGDQAIPSLASAISGNAGGALIHNIDYGIDSQTIPSASVVDLLAGSVDRHSIADRHVVLGTSAIELKDIFFTPNQGPLPGAVVQILAAETALAGRNVETRSPWWAVVVALLVVAIAMVFPIRSIALRIASLAIASLAVEAIALAIYLQSAVMVPTAPFHLAIIMLVLCSVFADTQLLSRLVRRLGGERDVLQAMLEQVIKDNYDGVLIAQTDAIVVASSTFADTFLARPLVGFPLCDLLPADMAQAAATLDEHGKSRDGEARLNAAWGQRDVEYVVTRSTLADSSQSILTVTFRDITERKQADAWLHYLAEHDPATDTLSRVGFLKALHGADAISNIFVLELERFGVITASLGHDAGDLLLRRFADRLKRQSVVAVAHLGKAQFAVATNTYDQSQEQFAVFAETVKRPFNLDGHLAKVGLSAGCAPAEAGEPPETWVRWAEAALLSMEDRNLGRLAVYDGTHMRRVARNRTLESQLAQALEEGQFFLQYQPQIELASGRMVAAEALLRWRRGADVVAPGEFLPITEETGMIVDITRWILVEACRTALGWDDGVRVAVNISALHFELGDLASDVAYALQTTGLPASRLELEITETASMSARGSAVEVLAELRAMGVTIAIDDFGTGQSSLAYLDHLPFDILKIDKAFVDKLAAPNAPHGIVQGIIGIARSMNKRVLAEGIETAHQAELLKRLGCEFGQGYHWSRPVDGTLIGRRAA